MAIIINSSKAQADIDYTATCAAMTVTQERVMSAQKKITGILAAGVFAAALLALFVPTKARADESIDGMISAAVFLSSCKPTEEEAYMLIEQGEIWTKANIDTNSIEAARLVNRMQSKALGSIFTLSFDPLKRLTWCNAYRESLYGPLGDPT